MVAAQESLVALKNFSPSTAEFNFHVVSTTGVSGKFSGDSKLV